MNLKNRIFYTCFIGFFLFVLSGCYNRKFIYREELKIKSCQKNWVYNDLTSNVTIKVLRFDAKWSFDLEVFPNLLIGVTTSGDTIAVVDHDFKGPIKKGDRVDVVPFQWSERDKRLFKPNYGISEKYKDNSLYCSFKNIYYGKIVSINKN